MDISKKSCVSGFSRFMKYTARIPQVIPESPCCVDCMKKQFSGSFVGWPLKKLPKTQNYRVCLQSSDFSKSSGKCWVDESLLTDRGR